MSLKSSLKYAFGAPTEAEMLDIANLPVIKKTRGYIIVGLFSIFFGSIFVLPGIINLSGSISRGTADSEMFFVVLILLVVGVPFILFGLNQLFARSFMQINQASVHYEYSSLFKRTKWDEKISNYEGILSRSESHPGNNKVMPYTLYILELYHKDKQKIIQLYVSPSEDGLNDVFKDFCRILQLPAVYKSGERFVKQFYEDIGKSIQELVSEDKMEVEELDWHNPPDGLAVELANDVITINILEPRPLRVVDILVLLFPFIPIFLGLLKGGPVAIVLAGLGGFLELIFMWYILSPFITTPQLRITFEDVQISKLTSFGKMRGLCFNRADIQKVYIKEALVLKYIIIQSNNAIIALGMGLSDESLLWLEQFILKSLS